MLRYLRFYTGYDVKFGGELGRSFVSYEWGWWAIHEYYIANLSHNPDELGSSTVFFYLIIINWRIRLPSKINNVFYHS